VYLIEHRTDAGRVLLYADAPGTERGNPAATLTAPRDIAAALELARGDGRFEVFVDCWIDLRKLRHTRDGSTALLSFGLAGGRIATVQVPAEVLELIRAYRQSATISDARPAWTPSQGRKPALVRS
jgi:hypothetical protein